MREVLFSVGSVLVFMLVCCAIAFNPLTVRAQSKLYNSAPPIPVMHPQPIRPVSTSPFFRAIRTHHAEEPPINYSESVGLA